MSIETLRSNPNNDISLGKGEPMSVPAINIVEITPQRVDLATRQDLGVRMKRDEKRRMENPGIVVTTSSKKVAEILGLANAPTKADLSLARNQVISIARRLNGSRTVEQNNKLTDLLEGLIDPERTIESISAVKNWYESLFPNVSELEAQPV